LAADRLAYEQSRVLLAAVSQSDDLILKEYFGHYEAWGEIDPAQTLSGRFFDSAPTTQSVADGRWLNDGTNRGSDAGGTL